MFRHVRSVDGELLLLSQSISNGLQQSQMQRNVLALIDYSRAYGNAWRDALLIKMFQKGIPSHMVRWIQAWLSNRLLRNRSVTLKQGVPQRSVLSPLLFLFYLDDLASEVGAPQLSLFADDVAMWAQDTDLERVRSKLQNGLDAVASWSTSWKLELSAQKSECFFFTTKTLEERWRPIIYLSRQQIMYNPNPKFLEITYDRQLTSVLHTSIVGSKMKQQAGALRSLMSTDWGYGKSILHSTYIATGRSMPSMQQRHGYHVFRFQ